MECQAASPGSRAAEELSGDVALQACIAATTSCVAVGNGYNPNPPGTFFATVVTLSNGTPSGPVQQITSLFGLKGVA